MELPHDIGSRTVHQEGVCTDPQTDVLAEERAFGFRPWDRWFCALWMLLLALLGAFVAVLSVWIYAVFDEPHVFFCVAAVVMLCVPSILGAMYSFNHLVFLATRYRIGADYLEIESPVSHKRISLMEVASACVDRYLNGEFRTLWLTQRDGTATVIGDWLSMGCLDSAEEFDRLVLARLKSHGVLVSEGGFHLWGWSVGNHAVPFLRALAEGRGQRLGLLRRLLP